ncbi:MAG: redoxin domain-containing protein [Porticoccaceae bacterium]|nr:redoxin domain-containing protein [Porticoccaceae bacterium]
MHRYLSCFKGFVAGLFLVSLQSYATNLPDELLNTPIHLISGGKTSLAEYRGKKPVYLKFWATWCQPCRKQMPHFENVQKSYGDEIVVIGINLGINDDADAVQKTIEEFGLTMPMAIDKSGDLAQKFRLIGTPYHLLFDKDMNLVHQGHEADESLDNKLALVAQTKVSEIIDSEILVEHEADIQLDTDDGKFHALFFTATWCDWYLKDSRPKASESCIAAQNRINSLYKEYPEFTWLGVVSRLWTGDQDLLEYAAKYKIEHPAKIDKSNRLFHQYRVNDLPVLILIKDGEVVARITDFHDSDRISTLLRHLAQ